MLVRYLTQISWAAHGQQKSTSVSQLSVRLWFETWFPHPFHALRMGVYHYEVQFSHERTGKIYVKARPRFTGPTPTMEWSRGWSWTWFLANRACVEYLFNVSVHVRPPNICSGQRFHGCPRVHIHLRVRVRLCGWRIISTLCLSGFLASLWIVSLGAWSCLCLSILWCAKAFIQVEERWLIRKIISGVCLSFMMVAGCGSLLNPSAWQRWLPALYSILYW